MGSYGCIVKDIFSDQKSILSCFHVLNGGNNWNNKRDQTGDKIINKKSESISEKYTGYLTNKLDVAYAEVSEDTAKGYLSKFKNPVDSLPVTKDDVFVTEVIINGSMTSDAKGISSS